MDQEQEIRNRWRIVFELADEAKRVNKMLETTSTKQVLADVDFLQKRVDFLEQALSDALNPARAKVGAAVVVQDGVLSYRVSGVLIPVSIIVTAFKIIQDVCRLHRKLPKDILDKEKELAKNLEKMFGCDNENPE